MPSSMEQADRRTGKIREQLEALRSPASEAAAALNDPRLLRATLERLVKILAAGRGVDAISIAVQVGAAREALHEFQQAVDVVERVTEFRRQLDELTPYTTAEAKVE